jgi:hypothetical protein
MEEKYSSEIQGKQGGFSIHFSINFLESTVAHGNVLYKTLAEVRNVWSKNTKKLGKFVTFERLWILFKTLFKH